MSFHRAFESAPRRGGALKVILIGLVLLAVLVVAGWILLLPGLVKGQLTAMSGFPVEAARISANPFGATVVVEGLEVKNPAEFPIPDFVRLNALDVRLKPMSLRGERVEIPRLVLDLEKVTVVTNKDGVSNAGRFVEKLREAVGGEGEETGTGSGGEETRPFHIGVLVVKLGRVETVDYSKGDTPARRVVELNVDRTFTDVTDAKAVAGPILGDILEANVSGLAGLFPESASGAAEEALRGASALLQDPAGLAGEEGEKAAASAKKLIESLKGGTKP